MPETHYAKCGDINIAYQVLGDGPIDLVYIEGWLAHLEFDLEMPPKVQFIDRLASFSRLIRFDKRGTGMSDREVGETTWLARVDDVRAVMDAVGSERAVIFGLSEGGGVGALFASMYPERTTALILCNTTLVAPEDREAFQGFMTEWRRLVETGWGTGVTIEIFAPDRAADDRMRAAYARYERMVSSPGTALGYIDNIQAWVDTSWSIPPPRVPTLVLHNTGDLLVPVEDAKATAATIPDAQFVEVPGKYHMPWLGDIEAMATEIQQFLTGMREQPLPDRVFATVLFSDIVGSTPQTADVGDATWRRYLDAYRGLIERQLERFDGLVVKWQGDGALITFDNPARAVRCARAIREGAPGLGLEVRAGVHTGEIERHSGDIGGIAVNIASRICDQAGPSQVLVSSTVRDILLGSNLRFADAGTRQLKGVPDEWQLFDAIG